MWPTTTASGRDSLVIGNFTNEMIALYHNEGGNLFLDKAPGGTIGRASMSSLTFSTFFFDFDLDGRPDIFAANGHVADDISKAQPKITHAQAPLLFRNVDGQKFDVADAGSALKERMVARGAAYADIDLDGDPDIAVNVNGGPARLFRNDGGSRSRALRLTLVRREIEPLRDRRARRRHARQRRETPRDGEVGIELSVAERAAGDVRPRRGVKGDGDRDPLARRIGRKAPGGRGESAPDDPRRQRHRPSRDAPLRRRK